MADDGFVEYVLGDLVSDFPLEHHLEHLGNQKAPKIPGEIIF